MMFSVKKFSIDLNSILVIDLLTEKLLLKQFFLTIYDNAKYRIC